MKNKFSSIEEFVDFVNSENARFRDSYLEVLKEESSSFILNDTPFFKLDFFKYKKEIEDFYFDDSPFAGHKLEGTGVFIHVGCLSSVIKNLDHIYYHECYDYFILPRFYKGSVDKSGYLTKNPVDFLDHKALMSGLDEGFKDKFLKEPIIFLRSTSIEFPYVFLYIPSTCSVKNLNKFLFGKNKFKKTKRVINNMDRMERFVSIFYFLAVTLTHISAFFKILTVLESNILGEITRYFILILLSYTPSLLFFWIPYSSYKKSEKITSSKFDLLKDKLFELMENSRGFTYAQSINNMYSKSEVSINLYNYGIAVKQAISINYFNFKQYLNENNKVPKRRSLRIREWVSNYSSRVMSKSSSLYNNFILLRVFGQKRRFRK